MKAALTMFILCIGLMAVLYACVSNVATHAIGTVGPFTITVGLLFGLVGAYVLYKAK